MNYKEIMAADTAKLEQKQKLKWSNSTIEVEDKIKPQPKAQPKTQQDQSIKTNASSWLNGAIGGIFLEYFPQLNCFRAQRNKAANEIEFHLFRELVIYLSADEGFQMCLDKIVNCKIDQSKSGEP